MAKQFKSTDKRVARETPVHYQHRPLIVELAPSYLKLRPKGLRNSEVAVDYEAIYELGLKMQARADRVAGGKS